MSRTVACFCGHLYTTPPVRCPACRRTLAEAVPPARPAPARVTWETPRVTEVRRAGAPHEPVAAGRHSGVV